MKERIRNNVYMTVSGLLLYLGSVWLSKSYHLPSDIAFGCFLPHTYWQGTVCFKRLRNIFWKKFFWMGMYCLYLQQSVRLGVGIM